MLSLERADHRASRLHQGLEIRWQRSKVEPVRRPEPECTPRVEGLGKPGEGLAAKDLVAVEDGARLRLVNRKRVHLLKEVHGFVVQSLGRPPFDRVKKRPLAADPVGERRLHLLRLEAFELMRPYVS